MNLNNLICPHCSKAFPLLVKPSRWVLRKWNESPAAKCPVCESIFRVRISKKFAFIILPLTILIMLLEIDFIERISFLQNVAGIIVGGALGGLTAGIGIRFCYVVDENQRKILHNE
jgi:hypothetical protein